MNVKKIYLAPVIKVKVVEADSILQASGDHTDITVDPNEDTDQNEWAAGKINSFTSNNLWEDEED